MYNFKKIQVVPSGTDFLDIVLSRTQRKTPTVVHKGYAISRIRSFYMRKVKYTQETFDEKLMQILNDFPKLEDIHPFYGDLMNILYDRDHYKLALGQLASAKHLIDKVGKEYLKLLKYGDSLFRCKALKRAALGRMATIMKRQKESLAYLEQVRQHMSRLPSIDASGRTLLLCGYPNVGKSSFMNCVTRAEVDVQPYAFTTKSLFVGHMDYKYLRWQVIDTPGLLDHPLEDRNTIEMQSITALAHLRASVLYFVDLSGQCGYTLSQQLSLFNSLKALFRGKPVMLVTTKSDILKPEDLPSEEAQLLAAFLVDNELPPLMSLSALQEEGVIAVRNVACDKLLEARVGHKLGASNGEKVTGLLNRLHQTVPKLRDEKVRAPHIPAAVLERQSRASADELMASETAEVAMTIDDNTANRLETDYNFGLQDRKRYLLRDDTWLTDIIPEIMSGKNISDYIDVDISAKLAMLEEEEQEFEERGHYRPFERDTELEALKSEVIQGRSLACLSNRMKRSSGAKVETMKKKRAVLRRKVAGPDFSGDEESERRTITTTEGDKEEKGTLRERFSERSPSRVIARSLKGFTPSSVTVTALSTGLSTAAQSKAVQLSMLAQKKRNRYGKAGEADRHHVTTMPKHLFAGKRKNGTHDRR